MEARQRQIARVLESVAGWARVLRAAQTGPFGTLQLSRSQTDALFLLAHAPSPPTPGELASILNLTPGAVTQLLDGLRREGLVRQQPHPRDARARVLSLSTAARTQVLAFEQATVARVADRFAGLDDRELETLADLLARSRHLP